MNGVMRLLEWCGKSDTGDIRIDRGGLDPLREGVFLCSSFLAATGDGWVQVVLVVHYSSLLGQWNIVGGVKMSVANTVTSSGVNLFRVVSRVIVTLHVHLLSTI
jgi:hypothetical protein